MGKTEKVIKKHFKGKVALGALIGLFLGLGIGFGIYYFASDDKDPLFYLEGDSIIYLEKGSSFTDPGYYLNDDVEVVITGSVDTNKEGSYVITYRTTNMSVLKKNGYDIELKRIIVVGGE